jgi:hypothetical protein
MDGKGRGDTMMDRWQSRVAGAAMLAVVAAACGSAGAESASSDRSEERVRTLNVEVAEASPRDFVHFVRVIADPMPRHPIGANRDLTGHAGCTTGYGLRWQVERGSWQCRSTF